MKKLDLRLLCRAIAQKRFYPFENQKDPLSHFSLKAIYEFLLEALKKCDFSGLTDSEMREKLNFLRLFSDLIEGIGETAVLKTYQRVLALGGKVPYDYLKNEKNQGAILLEANQFDLYTLPFKWVLSFTPQEGVGVYLHKEGLKSLIFFDSLEKRSVAGGYQFCQGDNILFQTDASYRFVDLFFGYGGLYHVSQSLAIADRGDPKAWDGGARVEIWTKEGKKAPLFLVVREAKGDIYSIGVRDKKLQSPCHFPLLLSDTSVYIRLWVDVSQEEIESLLGQVKADLKSPENRSDEYLLTLLQKELGLNFNLSARRLQKRLSRLESPSQKNTPKRVLFLEEVA